MSTKIFEENFLPQILYDATDTGTQVGFKGKFAFSDFELLFLNLGFKVGDAASTWVYSDHQEYRHDYKIQYAQSQRPAELPLEREDSGSGADPADGILAPTTGNVTLNNVSLNSFHTADFLLTPGTVETGAYGNKFNGQTDADGLIEAAFAGTSDDLLLRFEGYDVDFSNEIEVLLNGQSLGFLDAGVNNGLVDYQFTILASQQVAGENTISFVQSVNVNWAWGITNVVLHAPGPAIALAPDTLETGEYGNNFNGQTDGDGVVEATFTGSANDFLLSFNGYDVDFDDEIEVLLNGQSLGFLTTGVNNDLAEYQFLILADQQQAGENTISFIQRGDIDWAWGVTDVLLTTLPPEPVIALTVDVLEDGEYGNNYNGQTDRDGIIGATFTGTADDLLLSFDGFDIDFDDEVEVLLNNQSLGFLGVGGDQILASYDFMILASEQLIDENTINFVQRGDINWAWGVTDISLTALPPEPVIALEIGILEDGEYGNNFNGATDRNGFVDATFTSTGEDLALRFDGFDIDSDVEVEVMLNGASLGFLATGLDQALVTYEFMISAAQQDTGENTISFVQQGDVNWAWGITNIVLLPPDTSIPLEVGDLETGEYGNKFNGQVDLDGVVAATFSGTGDDLLLSFSGYDIDYGDEVEVLLNGASLGFLASGVNNGLASYEYLILDRDLLEGGNTVSFVQNTNINWAWGVTDLLLTELAPEPVIALTVDVLEDGEYGNNYNGATDRNGFVDATFTSTGEDLVLRFDGFDIDYDDEVEVLLNGASLGFLATGLDQALVTYEFMISAAQQDTGENTISFVQQGDVNWAWGVTDIILLPPEPPIALQVGDLETGEHGNKFNGQYDIDGVVDATFTGTANDLLLSFDGFDIDNVDEVEVLLNGESLGILSLGPNEDLASYEFTILSSQQLMGQNTISFVQLGDVNWVWGITNILLTALPPEPVVALQVGITETGAHGNNFNGETDRNGIIDATFIGTSEDLLLSFEGFDIDSDDEIEVLLNGQSLGFLPAGVNNGLDSYEFTILAGQQLTGQNTISFVQRQDINWTWGVTNITLDIAPLVFVPTDGFYAEQWHLGEIGLLERVWADYSGAGVSVALYDDGAQYIHHDLDDNYDSSKHPIVNGQALDPATGSAQHGTSVAGLIAAEANGVGTVGVAFDASITAIDIIDGPASSNVTNLSGFIQAMTQMTNFDVVNHSWSWAPTFDPYDPASADFYAQTMPTFENAAVNGRGGLGTVTVRASGNGGESAQGDLLTASRYTITVGASMDNGQVAPYSNYGSNLLVVAPSSGDIFSSNLAIKTTDRLGFEGYNFDDYTGTDPFTGFGGTSASAPIVTGLIALMMEANPNLGWRDVQTILAYSSTHTGTSIGAAGPDAGSAELFPWRFNDADNWNGGGLHYSEDYGYGKIDAYNAVRMAEIWGLFDVPQTSANELSYSLSGAPNLAVGAGTIITLDMTGFDLDVEHVEISLSMSDTTLDIFLISPDGTQMELFRDFDTFVSTLDWTFGVQGLRGSQLDGVWQLVINNPDQDGATLIDYTIEWWGRQDGVGGYVAVNDVYHFTDEIFVKNLFDASTGLMTAIADDITRTTIDDSDGGIDWLNMSALTGNLDISLDNGGVGTSSGRSFLTIGPSSDIENIVGGSGYDTLAGNAFDNIIVGMRGDDTLLGNDGNDDLRGGTGNDLLQGGNGNDILTGDADADMFVFDTAVWGQDVITDFDDGVELVDMRGSGFSAGSLNVTSSGGDAIADFGTADSIVFEGLAGVIDSNDFLF